jgi:hypothetical protein
MTMLVDADGVLTEEPPSAARAGNAVSEMVASEIISARDRAAWSKLLPTNQIIAPGEGLVTMSGGL